jgi:hypothetical protein
MVRVFHGDGLCLKTMSLGQSTYFFGVVVCHQKVPMQLLTERKKFFMVNFGMRVKTRTGTLAASGVWRINKKHCILFLAMLGDHFKSIPMNKLNALGNEFNVGDAFGESLWIPAGQNPFSVFQFFRKSDLNNPGQTRQTRPAKLSACPPAQ